MRRLQKGQGMALDSDSTDPLAEARQFLRAGQAPEAATCLRQMLATRPADAEAHAMLGVALAMSGERAAGMRSLETAIQLAPLQASHHFNLGQVREQGGDRSGAAAAYRQALEIDPAYSRAATAYQRLTGAPPRPTAAETGFEAPRTELAVGMAPWLVGAAAEAGVPPGPTGSLSSPDRGEILSVGPGAGPGPRSIADAPQIVKSIRWLYWLFNFMGAMAVIAILLQGQQWEGPAGRWVLALIPLGLLGLSIWLLVAIPRGTRAAYYVQMVLSGLGLLGFPIGTLLHGYILYYWVKPETKEWFGVS
jgi:tetratricopeptide (TPR) repeat protein